MALRDRSRRIIIPPSKKAANSLYMASWRVALISGGVCFSGYLLQDVFDKVAQPVPLLFKAGYVGLTSAGLLNSAGIALEGYRQANLTTIIDGNVQTITRMSERDKKPRYVCSYDSIDEVVVGPLSENLGFLTVKGRVGEENNLNLLMLICEEPYEMKNKILSL